MQTLQDSSLLPLKGEPAYRGYGGDGENLDYAQACDRFVAETRRGLQANLSRYAQGQSRTRAITQAIRGWPRTNTTYGKSRTRFRYIACLVRRPTILLGIPKSIISSPEPAFRPSLGKGRAVKNGLGTSMSPNWSTTSRKRFESAVVVVVLVIVVADGWNSGEEDLLVSLALGRFI